MQNGNRVHWTTKGNGAILHGDILEIENDEARIRTLVRTEDGEWEPTAWESRVALTDLELDEPVLSTRTKRGRLEHRSVKAAVLETRDATDDEPARAWLRVNDFTKTDTYGTRFAEKGVKAFMDAHPNRPTLLFGHGTQGGLASVLGHRVDWREGPEGLDVQFEFDNFDDVPSARQAYSQLKSGTLDSMSVGFIREAEEQRSERSTGEDYTLITKYQLPESSIVIEASNAGTGLLSMSGTRMTQQERATQTLIAYRAGDVELFDAVNELYAIFEARDPADGDGNDDGMMECPTCGGSGKIMEGKRTCPDCKGSGEVPDDGNGNDSNGNRSDDNTEEREADAETLKVLELLDRR